MENIKNLNLAELSFETQEDFLVFALKAIILKSHGWSPYLNKGTLGIVGDDFIFSEFFSKKTKKEIFDLTKEEFLSELQAEYGRKGIKELEDLSIRKFGDALFTEKLSTSSKDFSNQNVFELFDFIEVSDYKYQDEEVEMLVSISLELFEKSCKEKVFWEDYKKVFEENNQILNNEKFVYLRFTGKDLGYRDARFHTVEKCQALRKTYVYSKIEFFSKDEEQYFDRNNYSNCSLYELQDWLNHFKQGEKMVAKEIAKLEELLSLKKSNQNSKGNGNSQKLKSQSKFSKKKVGN